MSFEIIKKEIRSLNVDAIVCFEKPGLKLLHAGKLLRILCPGETYMTGTSGQRAARVIHTVLPVRQEQWDENLLRRCYVQSLELARKKGLRSVAFPLISAGKCGFSPKRAREIAVETIRGFLSEWELQVSLVLSEKEFREQWGPLADSLDRFVAANYIPEWQQREFGRDGVTFPVKRQEAPGPEIPLSSGVPMIWSQEHEEESCCEWDEESREPVWNAGVSYGREPEPPQSMPAPQSLFGRNWEEPTEPGVSLSWEELPEPDFDLPCPSQQSPFIVEDYSPQASFNPEELNRMVKAVDAGFSETLLDLIDRTGRKDSDVYKRANVDRKLFSKIRNNPNYKPSKATAVAFAIALELDLEETKDLIGRAGYALSRSSKFDIIIEYFITHKRYDILEINMMLYEFDQSLLGA